VPILRTRNTRARRALALGVLAILAWAPLAWLPAAGHEVDPITEYCEAYPNTGNPNDGRVGQGQSLRIVAGGSGFLTAIIAAEYLIDPLMPVDKNNHHQAQNGNPMTPVDGLWGGTDETAEAYNDTSYLPVGTYTIYVHVQGIANGGQWSAFKTCGLEVVDGSIDTSGPVATATGFDPDNIVGPGETLVRINATFDDTGDPGTATVADAEYWYSGCGLGLTPGDPASVVPPGGAVAVAVGDNWIDTTGWADGPRTYYIAAVDSLGNWGACYKAELFIIRNVPNEPQGPECTDVVMNPASVLSGPGATSQITAKCDDTNTGNNKVSAAEFFVDPDPLTGTPNPGPYMNGTGTSLFTSTPPWGDAAYENVVRTIDVSSWLVGIYSLRVHGRDNLAVWGNLTDTTLTILGPGPTNLRIAIQGNDLRLDWSPAGIAGLDHYNIYRSTADVNGFTFLPAGSPYATAPAGATSWIDPDANEAFDGSAYFYLVRAATAVDAEDTNTAKVGKHAVPMVRGVNEIGIPFELQDAATSTVFAHLAGAYSSVGQFDAVGGWTFFNTTGPQDLLVLDYRFGLRVVATQAVSFIAVGAVPGVTVTPLLAGWNLVSYNALVSGSVPAALDGNGLLGSWDAALKYVAGDPYDPWRAYRPGDPAFQDLVSLSPGDGLWIRATSPATWSLPGV
jgi:hypothetical protein